MISPVMRELISRSVPLRMVGVLLFMALLSGPAAAQSPMAGMNIGQRINPDDSRMVARGGWGMAVADTTHPGFKNLASLSYLRHVAVKYTGFGEIAKVESPQGSREVSGVYTPGIQFALPVIKNRMAVTSGFSMNRSSRWDSVRDSAWAVTDTTGALVEARSGTRFKVPLGAALRITRGLSISAAMNLEFGSTLEYASEFSHAPGVDPNLKETKDLYSGKSYTLGALWKPFSRLSMGASWTPAYTLDVDRRVKAVGVTARHEEAWSMNLPDEYMAGFELRFTDRWQLGADAQYMPFTKFSGNDAWAADMDDEITLGVGLERLKANVRRGGLGNLPLRLGVNYHRWAYQAGGAQIEERTVSIGTGFAFARELGQLDLSFSYGIIGDLEKNGVQSEVYRLGVSITGLESWW